MSTRYVYIVAVAADDAAAAIDKAKVVARRAGWTVRTLCRVRPESKGRWRVELAVVRPESVMRIDALRDDA